MDGPDTHGLTGESSDPDREDTNKRHGGQRYHFHRTRQRRMGVEVHTDDPDITIGDAVEMAEEEYFEH